jgi:hypothetical protein
MDNAIPVSSLQHLKSYLQSLQDGPFYTGQIENTPEGVNTNAEIELTRQLLSYYKSDWGTLVEGSSPEWVWGSLNEGSIGERLITLQIDTQMIDHFIDRYISRETPV